MKEYLYYSLKVLESDRQKLMKWLQESMYDYLYEECNVLIDHCTIMHRSQHDDTTADFLDCRLNSTEFIYINGIGWNDKAIAFRVVKTGTINLCKNEVPHITIGTYSKGKPVDSNTITNWKSINPIMITTIIEKVWKS